MKMKKKHFEDYVKDRSVDFSTLSSHDKRYREIKKKNQEEF